MDDPDVTPSGTGRTGRTGPVVARARSLLAEDNPVPGDAFSTSWREPRWQAELAKILASPRPEDSAAPRPARPRGPRRSPGRRWSHGRWRLAGLGAVGLAAAVAAVTVFAGVGPRQAASSRAAEIGVFRLPSGVPGANPGGSGAARPVLLAVANTVAHQPAPKVGAWWRGITEFGNFKQAGSPVSAHYIILERGRDTAWQSRLGGGPSTTTEADVMQWLGVQLASPADTAAWRRDGSPTTWNAPPDASPDDPAGYANANGGSIRAAPGRPHPEERGTGGSTLTYNGKPLSALPADPAVLRKLLGQDYRLEDEGGGISAFSFYNAPDLLTEPVTQAVRSAVYRVLAALPGAVNLGTVRDVNGQSGTGIALDARYPHCLENTGLANQTLTNPPTAPCTVQQRLIINPSTGLPLTTEFRYVSPPDGEHWPVRGGLFSYEIYGASGWTNQGPPTS